MEQLLEKPAAWTGSYDEASTPLYAQIKQMIIQQVQSGAWPAHYRVPSENELVVAFGFSRMTINRALRELASEGLLIRVQGVGTFVAETKGRSALFGVNNIADEIMARGHHHSCKVLHFSEELASHGLALAMELYEGHRVFHSLIVHYENEMAVLLEDRYVNSSFAPEYSQQNFNVDTLHAYLSRVAPLTEWEHRVEAILANAEECRLLAIERSEPCLLIRRRTWSGSLVVSSARLLHPGIRHNLEGRFSL